MVLGTFLAVVLPYCLVRQKDGSYVAINREYKPIGFNTMEWVEYDQFPVAVRYRKIHPNTLKKLNVSRSLDPNWIYLYNDGCNPLRDEAHMKSYLQKLSILAKMRKL